MIKAIEKNKTIKDGRSIFKQSEDYFTSSIFERLLYLPKEMFWEIIRNSCYGNDLLPKYTGEIQTVEFWPHWSAKHNDITREKFVEPDVFIRFDEFDLLIEAKRYDNKQQNIVQWKNQILSYKLEYGEDKKDLFLIALGGLYIEDSQQLENTLIIKSRWKNILLEVQSFQKQIENSVLSSNQALSNIFSDMILVFQMFGFSTGKWFENMPTKYKINSKNINSIQIW